MILKTEYQSRINRVFEQLQDNSIAIIAAATEQTRSNDTEFPFRQDSDFFYLTGFNEPDAYLVLVKTAQTQQTTLFCRAKDKVAEIWQGRRLGPEQALLELAIDNAYATSEFESNISTTLNGLNTVYWLQGRCETFDKTLFDLLNQLRKKGKFARVPQQLMDLSKILHEMRLIKSDAELAIMKKAAEISCEAHIRAMQKSAKGVYEYQLEAEILHQFAINGARFPAYNSIVAGGENACILHYTNNSDLLNDNELVLIDAGCELQGYAADITRTFPINGQFTTEQAQLYQLVLNAQTESIKLLKPGNTLKQASDLAVNIITQGLMDLGLLTGSLVDNTQSSSEHAAPYRQFFMHGLGHWLGLDVHDVGLYKINDQDRVLEAGMVLTVEPGIYVSHDAPVDSKWKGIGIRIEDNIVITTQGNDLLTAKAPKTIEAIESLMQQK